MVQKRVKLGYLSSLEEGATTRGRVVLFTFFFAFGVWCFVIGGAPRIFTIKFSLQWTMVDSSHSLNLYGFPFTLLAV